MGKDLNGYYKFEYKECVFKKKIIYKKGHITICKNNITLITGGNGTGKSTLLGRIYQSNNSNSTYICQDNYEIFKKLSVLENITFFQPDIDEKKVIQILEKYHMEGLLNKSSDGLSGGEKRIITILRGIMSEDELLFLDEPTNDLDYQTVDTIIKIINDYKTEKTFLVVTHDERLYPIAGCLYEIVDQQVVMHENKVIMEQKVSSQCNGKKVFQNKAFINKVFISDICGVLCLSLIVLLSVYLFYYLKKETSEEIERIHSDQIELCNSIYSEPTKLVNEGFIPTSFLAYLNSDISLNELSVALEKGIANSEERFYCLNLSVDQSINYQVYNLIRYDLSTSTLINTLDYCKSDNNNLDQNQHYIDTSKYFKYGDTYENPNNNAIAIEFNDKLYQNAIEEIDTIFEEDLENILVEIKLNQGYTFYDFIVQDKYREKWKSNYFIRSNETIEIVENAKNIMKFNKIIKLWIFGVGILSFIIIYQTIINWFLIKKKIIILKNYGFCKADIKKAVIHKYNNPKSYIISFIYSEVSMMFLYIYYGNIKEIKDYAIMVLLGVFLIITNRLQKGIYSLNIRNLYKIKGEL
ncbi:ATP-binding cassette domain-containing protein [Anaeromicropila populeti]|uniref:ABC transporter n=1 Tax=Anaeromicropila populeti TaxID=37658 RepID=A0A1I6JS38_9FIRM|nr:ATP-binding cassette domain-containing protein [Anaeromicropila populeti]SFR81787.1 ABC transporter [Anaeromicropila populeti]